MCTACHEMKHARSLCSCFRGRRTTKFMKEGWKDDQVCSLTCAAHPCSSIPQVFPCVTTREGHIPQAMGGTELPCVAAYRSQWSVLPRTLWRLTQTMTTLCVAPASSSSSCLVFVLGGSHKAVIPRPSLITCRTPRTRSHGFEVASMETRLVGRDSH